MTFILLQNLEMFLPSSSSGLGNSSGASMVISSQVGPRDSVGQSEVLQNNPITINFTFDAVSALVGNFIIIHKTNVILGS